MKDAFFFRQAKYQEYILKFCAHGFVATTNEEKLKKIDFLDHWVRVNLGKFVFKVHPEQKLFDHIDEEGNVFFLIGHAFNPFDGTICENKILQIVAKQEASSKQSALNYINELTGIFVLGKISTNGDIKVLVDCAGMVSLFYGVIDGDIILTTHSAIARLAYDLPVTQYANMLFNYRLYKLYGAFLPGDITQYEQLKRVVPNTIVSINGDSGQSSIHRFYPEKDISIVKDQQEYEKALDRICQIMTDTMKLIPQKWGNPAVSLTGGMDSKTTLSAINPIYDRYRYFSYITSDAEQIDAEAAGKICEALSLNHTIYNVSANAQDYPEFEIVRDILQFNKDYIGRNNTNDICKRAFFAKQNDFDIEVKSWVSEIARANYYKKFGKKKMPKQMTPRRCSCMYKLFLHNRKLLKQTDDIFRQYIEQTKLQENLHGYDWSDIFLWEIRYGSWGGSVITSEHKYSFDICIPYNNRMLLDVMLSTPLDKRRTDHLHKDIIAKLNKRINDTGINVINKNETKFREICEKIYFNVNSNLPF